MKKIINVLFLWIVVSTVTLGKEFIENRDIENIFISEGIKGTFVIYDVENNYLIGYNQKRGNNYIHQLLTL